MAAPAYATRRCRDLRTPRVGTGRPSSRRERYNGATLPRLLRPRAIAPSPYTARVRVAIGSDHAGFRLKSHLVDTPRARGEAVDDLGPFSEEPCDSPPICAEVARTVV